MILGTKILIVGVSASGKSTLARTLANKLDVPLMHIDALMWKPGWEYIGDEKTLQLLKERAATDKWIIEGYIEKEARPFVFERADSIIYLDYPGTISAWRYLKRWWKHRIHPRPELPGSPEKFDLNFLKLVWTKGEAISLNKYLVAVKDQRKITKLKSRKATKAFLKNYEIDNP